MTERDVPFLQAGNYTAAELRRVISAIFASRDFVDLAPSTSPLVSAGGGHGVIGSGDMLVSAGSGMTSSVAAGLAVVRGTQQSDQGAYITSNDAAKALTHGAADATNPRKDLIVTKVRDAEYAIAGDDGPLAIVAGTPTGGLTAGNATGRPTPPENSLVLAEVLVPAAAVSAASFTYTDLRTRAYAVGAIAACTSTTRPNPAYTGQTIFEIDTGRVYRYDGSAWRFVSGGNDPTAMRAYKTTAQNTGGAGTQTKVSLDATSYDYGSCFSNANDGYTVPRSGLVEVSAQAAVNVAAATERFALEIFVAGALVTRGADFSLPATGTVGLTVHDILPVTAAQVVDIRVNQISGAARAIENSGAPYSRLTCRMVP